MKQISKIAGLSIVLLLTVTSLSAQKSNLQGFEQGMIVELCEGYDELDPYENFKHGFFTCDSNPEPNSPRVLATSGIHLDVARSEREFFQKTNLNLSAEVKSGLSSASGNYNRYVESFRTSKSVHIILRLEKIYEGSSSRMHRLSDYGRSVLQNVNNPANVHRFRELAGSHIVTDIHRGATIDLVYSFYSTNSESLESVYGDFQASYSGSSASTSFLQEVERKYRDVTYSMNSIQKGGGDGGASVVEIFDRDPGNIREILRVMKQVYKDLTYENSTLRQFNTKPIGQIPDVALLLIEDWAKVDLLYKNFDREVTRLYFNYYQLSEFIRTLRFVFNETPLRYYVEGGREKLDADIDKFDAELVSMLRHYGKLSNNSTRWSEFTKPGNNVELKFDFDPANARIKEYLRFPFGQFKSWMDSHPGTMRTWYVDSTPTGFRHFSKVWTLELNLWQIGLIRNVELYVNGIREKIWKKSDLTSGAIYFPSPYDVGPYWTDHGRLNDIEIGRALERHKSDHLNDRYEIIVNTIDLDTHTFEVENIYGEIPSGLKTFPRTKWHSDVGL